MCVGGGGRKRDILINLDIGSIYFASFSFSRDSENSASVPMDYNRQASLSDISPLRCYPSRSGFTNPINREGGGDGRGGEVVMTENEEEVID